MSNENLPFKRAEGDTGDNAALKRAKGTCYLTLLQDNSNPCKKSNQDEYVEGAEPGLFFLSRPKVVLTDSVDVIVHKFFEYVQVVSINNKNEVLERHLLGDAIAQGLIVNYGGWSGNWETKEGNPVILHYGYLMKVIGQESEGLVQYSLKYGGIKDGEHINSLLDREAPDGKPAEPHMSILTFKAASTKNDKGSWFKIKPSWKGWVNAEQYEEAVKTKREMEPMQTQIAGESQTTEKVEAKDVDVNY